MSNTVDDVEKKSGELNNESSVGAKILMFLSGVALIALILFLFTVDRAYSTLGILIILGVCLSVMWGCMVFIWNIPLRFNRPSSHLCNRVSVLATIILDTVLVILSGLSLVGYSMMISALTVKKILCKFPFGNILCSMWDNNVLFIWLGVIVLGILSFFVLCVVLHTAIGTRLRDAYLKDGKKTITLFAIASALWVFVPLLSLYLTNIDNVSLLFVLLLAAAYIIFTLIIYFIGLFISKSSFVAFCSCVIMWIGLSLSESICNSILAEVPFNGGIYSLVLIIIMAAAGFGVFKLIHKFDLNVKNISKWVLLLVVVVVLISAVPLVINSVDSQSSLSEGHSFEVNPSLQHPNIYWIHAESMVDTSVLEKYWGEDTVGLDEELTKRDFSINHDSYITGVLSGSTSPSLSSLFVPSFFDEYGSDEFVERSVIVEKLETQHELIQAFENAEYNTTTIMGVSDLRYIRSPTNIIYFFDEDNTFIVNPESISLLDRVLLYDKEMESGFIKYSAFPLGQFFETAIYEKMGSSFSSAKSSELPVKADAEIVNALYPSNEWLSKGGYGSINDILASVLYANLSPSLTFIYPHLAHALYEYDKDGYVFPVSPDVADYYGQYLFSERVILYYVDEILKHDSNAIIIIQGDHGPHHANFEGYEAFFEKDPRLDEYKGHVLSAIRIPPQYQTEGYEEILKNPRNIVRYLINNYVGQNYEYLPTENYA